MGSLAWYNEFSSPTQEIGHMLSTPLRHGIKFMQLDLIYMQPAVLHNRIIAIPFRPENSTNHRTHIEAL